MRSEPQRGRLICRSDGLVLRWGVKTGRRWSGESFVSPGELHRDLLAWRGPEPLEVEFELEDGKPRRIRPVGKPWASWADIPPRASAVPPGATHGSAAMRDTSPAHTDTRVTGSRPPVTASPTNIHEAFECVRLGTAAQQQGDWSTALRYFQRARDIDPQRGNQASVALCLVKLGRYEEALRICNAILAADQDYAWAAYYKIDALLGLKRYGELLEYTDFVASQLGAGDNPKIKHARDTALRHAGER